jgi:RimJ/RimL family protein N-acetyltransferase
VADSLNHLGQPIGFEVPDWSSRPLPPNTPMTGRYCSVVPLDPEKHAPDLHAANMEDREGRMWTYLAQGPYGSLEEYLADMKRWPEQDWYVHAIIDAKTHRATGVASYLRVDRAAGSIEVGGIMYSPRLQRTIASTEAMYLMMRRAFDELGYRRYEWKCNALNRPSMDAARRLGFQFEGIFRQATIVKGRNRDTAWFAIVDRDWPRIKSAFETWLAPENFDVNGRQRRSLAELRE